MNCIRSDHAQAQASKRVKEILRTFCINDRTSEPYRGNQNNAEHGWKDTKTKTQLILDTKNAPSKSWLTAGQYVATLQNHMAYEILGWRTPFEWLHGYTPDISPLLQFEFYEPVYYQKYDAKFPQDSTECVGRFIGVSEYVGHGMTYKILTEDEKIIHRAVASTARLGN
ncbi:Retrotransposon protein [Seminavis robusta]|uniref:Retrotransposon protein n=1 Tax=Seminavis robusta TaxID=568900 RepID=A0A9N8EI26_9STRA|nr:Retrotransposon protein [Seminavis robusta]|eukprot:Sro1026_g232850.1 Retrotransposon protein (169) ;mRNA; f:6066-6572